MAKECSKKIQFEKDFQRKSSPFKIKKIYFMKQQISETAKTK